MKKIAINGLGIAGPTLAWWLKEYGFEPVIFEKAPEFRTGGYLVDFWGNACEVLKKMNLFEQLQDKSYLIKNIHCFDDKGNRSSKVNISELIKGNYNDFLSLKRGDISQAIYNACQEKNITIKFGVSIDKLHDKKDHVTVELTDGSCEDFDLVIGADGLHSHIRSLAFNKNEYQENDLNKYIAAFSIKGYEHYEKFTYGISVGDKQQVARVSIDENETLAMFIMNASLVDNFPVSLEDKKLLLSSLFKEFKWESPEILSHLEKVDNIYFDKVSQIRMSGWHKNRVALVGDAASCPSILMGLGSIFAIIEAYVLAGELYKAKGDHAVAFNEWQNKLKDIIDRKQKIGLANLSAIAPEEIAHKYLSKITVKISSTPVISKFIGAAIFNEQIDLPEYK